MALHHSSLSLRGKSQVCDMVNSCGITSEEEKGSVCTGNILMIETLFNFVGMTCETKVRSAKHIFL